MNDQFSSDRIQLQVRELFHKILLTPMIEITKVRLPEWGQGVVERNEAQIELGCRLVSA